MSKLSDSERFKRKYQTDAEFRERHKASVTAHKKRKARERKQQGEKLQLNRKQWRVFEFPGGKKVQCCRISYLASALGRNSKRIREWESAGDFPETIRHKNYRYYTKKHYNMILRCWKECNDGKDLQSFFVKVRDNWNKYL